MRHPTLSARAWFLFGLLSLADLLLTMYLLSQGPGRVAEANPLAAWCLGRFGYTGLALVKATSVLLAGLLALAVGRRRPRAAHRFLVFACVAVAGALLSGGVTLAALLHGDADSRVLERAALKSRGLEQKIREGHAYRRVVQRLAESLAANRLTLEEAVAELAATAKGRDPGWRATLRVYFPAASDEESLAGHLIDAAVFLCHHHPAHADEVGRRLREEFRDLYGADPPVRRLLSGASAEYPDEPPASDARPLTPRDRLK